MPKNIFIEQNTELNLQLLAAQRFFYSCAKNYRTLRTFFSIILAIVGPILFYYCSDYRSAIMIVGAAWALFSEIFLRHFERESLKMAAAIQEQFDVGLFDLPWNEILVDKKVTSELIQYANRKFSGNRENLKNWYADTSSFSYPLNVLLCQRSNIVWDWRLRRAYGYFISFCTILVFVGGILLGLILHINLFDYLTGIFIPQFAAIHLGFEVSKNQIAIANEKELKENILNSLVDKGLEDSTTISQLLCRQIQDFIYCSRISGTLVPDFCYNLLKQHYEFDMNLAIDAYRKRFK